MPVALIVLAAGTVTAATFDLRTGKIPNALTGTMVLAAIGIHGFDGISTLFAALAVMLAVFACGTLAYSAGWLGGGDVKLVAACCGLAGYAGALTLILFVLIAGAGFALADAACRRRLKLLLTSAWMLSITGSVPARTALPYGVAIAGGTLAYIIATLRGFSVPL
jgi:prepilin peptidase CpaA